MAAVKGKKKRIICFITAFLAPLFFSGIIFLKFSFAGELTSGQKNYYEIKKLYFNWQKGPPYSRFTYKRDLVSLLRGMIGKSIETDNSFKLESPGEPGFRQVKCNLLECRWLNFHGDVDIDNIRDLVKDDPGLMKKWWRTSHLFSISGTVKKFRMSRDSHGDTVELFLEKITIKGRE